MLRVVVLCDGPSCTETAEQDIPTGIYEECRPFIGDWLTVADRNASEQSPPAHHFCCLRCLSAWSLQRQLDGAQT